VAERLRALLEDPLDARVARAALALAAVALLGFAAVAALGLSGGRRETTPDAVRPAPVVSRQRGAPVGLIPSASIGPAPASARPRRQDPQDRPGTTAHLRAERELADHRALQHLPYRHAGIAVALVGARGPRAVVLVRAGSVAAARRGWRAFVRRYRDPGAAYLPVFVGRGQSARDSHGGSGQGSGGRATGGS
jgi:hypothetical protein